MSMTAKNETMRNDYAPATDIQFLSPDLLEANDYNPNSMTDDEFGELVTEVIHLGGRLPKPIIVRSNGEGGYIVGTDFSDGKGRFPQLHGTNADGGHYGNRFADEMWAAYVARL